MASRQDTARSFALQQPTLIIITIMTMMFVGPPLLLR